MAKTTYILVHGTGDEAPSPAGGDPKWWQPESDYAQELLAAAPAGSRIEAFIWSGLNDEVSRRAAARNLFRRLKSADEGEEIVLVGHSHGGSVIATTLKLAAAAKKNLPQLVRWVTVGTPFIQMRRNLLPWARYDVLGLAVFSFAILGAIGGIASHIELMNTSGWASLGPSIGRVVGLVFAAMSVLLLWFRSRGVRPLYPRRGLTKFEEMFSPRWASVSSSHDEAVGALTRVTSLRPILFEPNLVRGTVRAIILIVFLFLFALSYLKEAFDSIERFYDWLAETPLMGPVVTGYISLNEWFLEIFGSGIAGDFWSWLEGLFDYLPFGTSDDIMFYVGTALYCLFMLLQLFVLLKVGDILTRFTFGRWIANALNSSAHGTITSKAYGDTTIGERAIGASSSPFPSISSAHPMPDPANTELIAYAHEHAASTLNDLHNELFGNAPEGDIAIDRLIGQISWREMVHTAYFKVPSSREHIIALTLGQRGLQNRAPSS